MTCPKCKSTNVTTQVVMKTKSVKEHKHSVVWWIFIGCWWIPIKWLFFFLPISIYRFLNRLLFGKELKDKKIVSKKKVYLCCNECGHTWKG